MMRSLLALLFAVLPCAIVAPLVPVFAAAPAAAGSSNESEEEAPKTAPKLRAPRIIWKSARVVAYQLRRLTNEQLLLVERSPEDAKFRPVYEALLSRPGIAPEIVWESVTALAKLDGDTEVAQVLAAIGRLPEDEPERAGPVLSELLAILRELPAAALRESRPVLLDAIRSDAADDLRRVAWLGLLIADGGLGDSRDDGAWALASSQPKELETLLETLPLVEDADVRRSFNERVPSLLAEDDSALRHAALAALPWLPGLETESFRRLAVSFDREEDRDVAVRALRRVPAANWPAEETRPLAERVIESIAALSTDLRTTTEALERFQLGQDLAARLPAAEGAAIRRALAGLGVRIVVIETLPDQMAYDRKFVAVRAGEPVELVLRNPDIMPHNLVLVAPGAIREVGVAAEALPAKPEPGKLPYVPDSDKVLQATPLVPPGGDFKLKFTAPSEPGEYPYVCTFPGHWLRMYGVLVVVEDVESWLASGTEPADPLGHTRRLVQAWKLADFERELAMWRDSPVDANAEAEKPARGGHAGHEHATPALDGQKLFTEAGCAACHTTRGEGGRVGPALDGVRSRHEGDPARVLREVLAPAEVVEEAYRPVLIQTTDNRTLSGLVTAEDADSVSIVTNPQKPVAEKLPRAQILVRVNSDGSMMPRALLDNYTRDEVLAILRYLLSLPPLPTGDAKPAK